MRREDFVIQTKWFVVPDVTNVLSPTHAPARMLRASLERMRLDFVDEYLGGVRGGGYDSGCGGG